MSNTIQAFKNFQFLTLIVIFIFILSGTASAQTCPDNLISYWKLDETGTPTSFADSSDLNSNDGSCSGAACPTPAAGTINGAMSFDGSDEVDVLSDASLDFSDTDSFSVEMWINTTQSSPDNKVFIGKVGSNMQWWLGLNNGTLIFYVEDSNDTSGELLGTSPINDENWHHVVGIVDRQNSKIRIYVDGINQNTVTKAFTGEFTGEGNLQIGHLATNYHYNGLLDEIALYKRVLSETEINSHYYLTRGYCDCSSYINIMPLGDSITRGNNSGAEPEGEDPLDPDFWVSYRKDLYENLLAVGYEVDFVGSLSGGGYSFDDPEHEGHGGWGSDQLRDEIYGWLEANPADVVLLHAGTIDLSSPPASSDDVEAILDEIDRYEAFYGTSITVILARIINSLCCFDIPDPCDRCEETTAFNESLAAMAEARIANGDKIILVDMENGAGMDYHEQPDGDMWDTLHPYDTGYAKIAAVWYDALATFLPLCGSPTLRITSTPLTRATAGKLYSYDVDATGIPTPEYVLTTWPTGMTLDTNDGLIEWTPDTAGDFDVTVEAGNSEGTDTQSFTINVFDASPCPANMSHFWKLDETGTPTSFFDSSAGAYNATCTNCPAPATGILNGAQQFDGSNAEVNVADDGTFDWGTGKSFSIEFWMNTSTVDSGTELMLGRSTGGDVQCWFGYDSGVGQTIFYLRNSSRESLTLEGGPLINDGEWHHIVAVRDASTHENTLYVDGAVAAGPQSLDFLDGFPGSVDLNIGHVNNNNHYNGILDEIALFNGPLDIAEIQEHYNERNGLNYCSQCQTDEDCPDDGNACTDDSCAAGQCVNQCNAADSDDPCCSDSVCLAYPSCIPYIFEDRFQRSDSTVVGNNWIEVEGIAQTIIANGKLVFEALDEAFTPLVYNTFPLQTSGVITWTFDLNFRRTGSETTYAFWMQLGEGSQMSETSPTESGIAINLKWGGPNQGLTTHEGLGHVINGSVSQIATVSGEQQVSVQIDLNSQTYIVTIGGQATESIPFENIVPIDTVRFFADLLNQNNFASTEIGNVVILREPDIELCDDGIDNDGDGDADCLDSDCEGLTCDDGDPCTETDTCAAGFCESTPPLDCDDGSSCTDDSCATGQCVNQCNAADSDDPCCGDTVCVSEPVCAIETICDDGIDNDVDGDTDCVDSDCEGLTCDDGDPCTEADTCAAGFCEGTPLDCDDVNSCTDDSCVAGLCINQCNAADSDDTCCIDSSCVSEPVCIDFETICDDAIDNDGDSDIDCADSDCAGLTCDDGDLCTESDTCSGGLCAGIPLDCDDINDCTDDSCVAGFCVNQCNAADSDDPCCSDSVCLAYPSCIPYIFEDRFQRSDSTVVGNNWIEVEGISQTIIANGNLVFEARDDAFSPLIYNAFPSQIAGVITWTFDLNFRRTGPETTYAFWMQLGDGSQMSETSPTESGIAINLKWGGPNQGLTTHEGLGYVINGSVSQIATVSGEQQVSVQIDLNSQTYIVTVGGQVTESIPFENIVPIDTVRFFADLLYQDNFTSSEIGNVLILREPDIELCDDGIDNDGDGDTDCVDSDCEGLNCDDGDPCTVTDTCAAGFCEGTPPLDCDDGSSCTDDSCASGQCVNQCNAADSDDPCCGDSVCVSEPVCAIETVCDDGIDNDVDGDTDCVDSDCDGLTCDDGDPCTEADTCAAGFCEGTPLDCDDGNSCTDDSCVAGLCINQCNAADSDDTCCSDSVCVSEPVCAIETICDDGIDNDGDGDTDCVDSDCDGLTCDDGDPCTEADTCAAGFCESTPPLDCDDGNSCTDDSCGTGQCVNQCNALDFEDPCCSDSVCVSEPVCIDATDVDSDGIPNDTDNCRFTPNGPDGGTCSSGTIGTSCMTHGECGTGGFCSMNQEDTDEDGIGDVCLIVFPDTTWIEDTPESQGVYHQALDDAMSYLASQSGEQGTNRAVVIRNGYLIWKGSEFDTVSPVWSATKSFTSTVLGLLIDDGEATLDTLASDFLPSMAPEYPDLTLRHFTTMTSGYDAGGSQSSTWYNPTPPLSPPGTRFQYWDSAMNQFANVLTRITNQELELYFKERIADPINMDEDEWYWVDFGTIDDMIVSGGAGNLSRSIYISPRQLARMGLLFLNKGNWNDMQLISESWVGQATTVQVPVSLPHDGLIYDGVGRYGFNWWANGIGLDGQFTWPNAPNDTYAMMGFNNNVLMVLPKWNMVIVRQGVDLDIQKRGANSVWDVFLGKMSDAIIDVEDSDADGIHDDVDSCLSIPNGPERGTCTSTSDKPGAVCTGDGDCVIGCSINGECSLNQEDADADGLGDVCDNCPDMPNGPYEGTCTSGTLGSSCITHGECGTGGFCSMNQEDTDEDGIGDVCDT